MTLGLHSGKLTVRHGKSTILMGFTMKDGIFMGYVSFREGNMLIFHGVLRWINLVQNILGHINLDVCFAFKGNFPKSSCESNGLIVETSCRQNICHNFKV